MHASPYAAAHACVPQRQAAACILRGRPCACVRLFGHGSLQINVCGKLQAWHVAGEGHSAAEGLQQGRRQHWAAGLGQVSRGRVVAGGAAGPLSTSPGPYFASWRCCRCCLEAFCVLGMSALTCWLHNLLLLLLASHACPIASSLWCQCSRMMAVRQLSAAAACASAMLMQGCCPGLLMSVLTEGSLWLQRCRLQTRCPAYHANRSLISLTLS